MLTSLSCATVQLLGELLLERSNLKVMVRYVADEDNLKLMMNLLRDSSRSIQFEAFHVFKVSLERLDYSRALTVGALATFMRGRM